MRYLVVNKRTFSWAMSLLGMSKLPLFFAPLVSSGSRASYEKHPKLIIFERRQTAWLNQPFLILEVCVIVGRVIHPSREFGLQLLHGSRLELGITMVVPSSD